MQITEVIASNLYHTYVEKFSTEIKRSNVILMEKEN
jgi:hypothetical protein